MANSLLQRSTSITGASPQFQPSSAGGSFFNELSTSLQRTSQDMQSKADNLYINDFLTGARKGARDIYNKNIDNPDQLNKELSSYKDGLLNNMPAALKPRLENEYGSLSESYLDKATTARNKVLTLQQNKALVDNENQILNDVQFAARGIFSNENLTPDEINSRNITTINRVAVDFDALDKNLSAVGADGNPLRTPEQAVKSLQKAKEFFFSEVASSWLSAQPNKLEAYSKWKNNEVTIPLPEGTINVRDAMTPEVRAKIDKQLIQNIKNEIFVSDKQNDIKEKQDEEFSDNLKKDFFKLSTSGQLTPNMVEASRGSLEYNDYKDLLKISKEANPITNGTTYGDFINKLENGEDISDDLRIARFEKKSLSNEDYEKLLDRNKSKGAGGALPDSVEEGRDFLMGFLGSSSQALSITESAVMAKAEREYNSDVQDFIDINGRKPTRKESMGMADEVADRYNIIQTDKFAATLPKPKAMSISVKTKMSELTPEALDKVEKDTFNLFMQKHNSDEEAVKNDPEFLKELRLLKAYQPIAAVNQSKANAAQKKTRK
jgi:hypothetical protein